MRRSKYGIIKFWYIVASCWIFLYEFYYDAPIQIWNNKILIHCCILLDFLYELYYDARTSRTVKILTVSTRQNAARWYPLQLCGADIIRRPFALTWDFIFDPVHKTMFFYTATNVRLLGVACATLDYKKINPTHIITPYLWFVLILSDTIPPGLQSGFVTLGFPSYRFLLPLCARLKIINVGVLRYVIYSVFLIWSKYPANVENWVSS
jgi:hypothetical protein